MSHTGVTAQIVVKLLVLGPGYSHKRVGLVSRDDGGVLNRCALCMILPALTLKAMLGAELAGGMAILPSLFGRLGCTDVPAWPLPPLCVYLDPSQARLPLAHM